MLAASRITGRFGVNHPFPVMSGSRAVREGVGVVILDCTACRAGIVIDCRRRAGRVRFQCIGTDGLCGIAVVARRGDHRVFVLRRVAAGADFVLDARRIAGRLPVDRPFPVMSGNGAVREGMRVVVFDCAACRAGIVIDCRRRAGRVRFLCGVADGLRGIAVVARRGNHRVFIADRVAAGAGFVLASGRVAGRFGVNRPLPVVSAGGDEICPVAVAASRTYVRRIALHDTGRRGRTGRRIGVGTDRALFHAVDQSAAGGTDQLRVAGRQTVGAWRCRERVGRRMAAVNKGFRVVRNCIGGELTVRIVGRGHINRAVKLPDAVQKECGIRIQRLLRRKNDFIRTGRRVIGVDVRCRQIQNRVPDGAKLRPKLIGVVRGKVLAFRR